MHTFAGKLKAEMLKVLPGIEVQWAMASSDRMLKNFPRSPGTDARIAAVLILLYPGKGSVYTVFIQRPDYDGVHSGQISFPGGKQENVDDGIIQTAIREAKEEIGVDPALISVIGTLTPLFIPVSNMLVTPVVGWTEVKPHFHLRKEEVVYVFDEDLKRFFNPAIVKTKPKLIRGETYEIKYFDIGGKVVWGATAMILNELLTIINVAKISLKL